MVNHCEIEWIRAVLSYLQDEAAMALDLVPPPPAKTLTPTPTPEPPKKPPDPSLSVLFPEWTLYCAPDNPFRTPVTKETKEEYKRALNKVTDGLRSPFAPETEGPVEFNGKVVGVELMLETFNSAVTTVIAAVERGYFPARDPTPLSPRDWARLAYSLVAAIG